MFECYLIQHVSLSAASKDDLWSSVEQNVLSLWGRGIEAFFNHEGKEHCYYMDGL